MSDDRFELFDQVDARFPKVLAALFLLLVMFLVVWEVIANVDLGWTDALPDIEVPGIFDGGPVTEDGCKVTPEGILICDRTPDT